MYACKYRSKIKLYYDGSDRSSMVEMNKHSWISGFTTNPSLMRKAGVKDYQGFCKEILTQIRKPISFEVFADDFVEMKRQARIIASWAENVYVKIPVTNTKAESSSALINELSHSGVKLNVTAIFTLDQVEETCRVLKGGAPSIVSVFAGRIADAGIDPVEIMRESLKICVMSGENIELLWASTREPFNIIQAEELGCHIITVPPDMLKKISNFGKNLKDYSLETVRMFKTDAESAGFSL